MARVKSTPPEFPTEAYQFAETYHLGTPLKMYRAHFTDSLGCLLAILGGVIVLIPLGGFMYDDFTFSPILLQVTGYCVVVFSLIAGMLLLPGFLTRKVRVYLCSRGLIYIRIQPAKRRVVFWEQVSRVESPEYHIGARRPSAVRMIGRDLFFLFGWGGELVGLNRYRWSASDFDYCIVHLEDGHKIAFSQWITNLSGLATDIRRHLRRPAP